MSRFKWVKGTIYEDNTYLYEILDDSDMNGRNVEVKYITKRGQYSDTYMCPISVLHISENNGKIYNIKFPVTIDPLEEGLFKI